MVDQQTTLTNLVHKESKFGEDLCWKQLDFFEDEMSCNVPALREALTDQEFILINLRSERIVKNCILRKLQAQLDEQVMVFKQSDLTLCIRKYFYTFELFTDS
jgi:hypothetical protein